jgi:hypothetical protein
VIAAIGQPFVDMPVSSSIASIRSWFTNGMYEATTFFAYAVRRTRRIGGAQGCVLAFDARSPCRTNRGRASALPAPYAAGRRPHIGVTSKARGKAAAKRQSSRSQRRELVRRCERGNPQAMLASDDLSCTLNANLTWAA